jgi:hypothetical protein
MILRHFFAWPQLLFYHRFLPEFRTLPIGKNINAKRQRKERERKKKKKEKEKEKEKKEREYKYLNNLEETRRA